MSTVTLFRSIVWIRKGASSTYNSGKVNHPSLMTNWTCQRNTLQSLVARENELCHLQYARRFNSSSSGMAWDNLMFPLLSNSSNMWSHLETSKVKMSFFSLILFNRLKRWTKTWHSLRWPYKLSNINFFVLIVRTIGFTLIVCVGLMRFTTFFNLLKFVLLV
jgi:hypothetical protein